MQRYRTRPSKANKGQRTSYLANARARLDAVPWVGGEGAARAVAGQSRAPWGGTRGPELFHEGPKV